MAIFSLTACDKDNVPDGAFNNGSGKRNLIVVISDMHLGADPAYAEIHDNLDTLEAFLEKIRESRNVKELVIGGDLLDEWYIPATTDTYGGGNQADFVSRIAAANRGVIDKFNQIISERKILVSYVPGNHDMAISAANINLILPGINQIRDAAGVGTYSPAGYPEIAIEHGHRYNIIAAPTLFPTRASRMAPYCLQDTFSQDLQYCIFCRVVIKARTPLSRLLPTFLPMRARSCFTVIGKAGPGG